MRTDVGTMYTLFSTQRLNIDGQIEEQRADTS